MHNFASILDYHLAQRPEALAVVQDERSLTVRQLHERVNQLAAGLAELGVGCGDVVGLLLCNQPEFLELVYAVNRLGAVFLPLNYRLSEEEWQYILGHAQAKVIVTEREFVRAVERSAGCLTDLGHRVLIGGGEPSEEPWTDYEELLARHKGERVEPVDVELDDLQRLMYTSGTTSRPKGVRITYGNLQAKNLAHIVHFGLTAADTTLVCGPLYHVGGLDMPALGVLHAGGSVVLQRKFDPQGVLDAIEKHRVTNVWLAPAMVNAVLEVPDREEYDTSSVRFVLGGGEKTPEPVLRRIMTAFPNAWFADAYGLTETVSGDTFLDREHALSKLGSVGRPVPHTRVRIVDDTGVEVPGGELGEITLRGPKVFAGYWRDEKATAAALRDGWFHTGDIGHVDEDGFLYIDDRKKDMIVSGGENIATPEVERVLYEHPAVLEAAVVGLDHPRWGEVPRAFVVFRPGEDAGAEELREFCRARLARFKVPARFDIVDELPRTPSGKVLKRTLRDIPAEG
ncbi:Acyl-CoA synthetase (AMP-forming)/AMP-acid ligase II [Streptomyces sp. 3213]|uniref:acyl-CoA synthetase n=1 Tax=Streptomyces sp. 3213.3 TaxID=1855348 RepID=UPI000898CBA6|nr:long-chain fatty acid--CoA ligase [Streptomyces sp. 3213.3]SEE74027.1 Acyl-CoA synthetase (AMP-forming)/AMP-acid ligase II [Streptomyces sp. 3213] [Streptomyces sp. 3213.3]